MKNDKLLHKWFEGNITEAELAEFKNRPEYASLVKIRKTSDELAIAKPDSDLILQEILSSPKHISSADTAIDNKGIRKLFPYLSIAASFLILLTLFTFFNRDAEPETFKIHPDFVSLNLPDGSTYVLNKKSSLEIDEASWQNNRSVRLYGEALFHVKKGSSFKVKSPLGDVQVLGTIFNVRDWGQSLEVSCKEGKVKVSSKVNKQEKNIIAGEVVRMDTDGNLSTWKTPKHASWSQGLTRLKAVKLFEVLEELERHYDIDIEIDSRINKDTELSCNFIHDDLKKALKTSLGPLGIEYKIEGKKVYLNN